MSSSHRARLIASKTFFRVASNISKINKGMGYELSLFIGTTIRAVGSAIVAFIINWQLSLVMMCTVPFVYGGLKIFSKVGMTIFND